MPAVIAPGHLDAACSSMASTDVHIFSLLRCISFLLQRCNPTIHRETTLPGTYLLSAEMHIFLLQRCILLSSAVQKKFLKKLFSFEEMQFHQCKAAYLCLVDTILCISFVCRGATITSEEVQPQHLYKCNHIICRGAYLPSAEVHIFFSAVQSIFLNMLFFFVNSITAYLCLIGTYWCISFVSKNSYLYLKRCISFLLLRCVFFSAEVHIFCLLRCFFFTEVTIISCAGVYILPLLTYIYLFAVVHIISSVELHIFCLQMFNLNICGGATLTSAEVHMFCLLRCLSFLLQRYIYIFGSGASLSFAEFYVFWLQTFISSSAYLWSVEIISCVCRGAYLMSAEMHSFCLLSAYLFFFRGAYLSSALVQRFHLQRSIFFSAELHIFCLQSCNVFTCRGANHFLQRCRSISHTNHGG